MEHILIVLRPEAVNEDFRVFETIGLRARWY